jgi:two-component system OmpR family sensor kinase
LQEHILLSSVIGFLRVEWPELEVNLLKDAKLLADEQALKSVFRNILQNAWLHGEARKVEIRPIQEGPFWSIEIIDDGKGLKSDVALLGTDLLKSKSSTSNGLGLFLTQDLVKRMKGKISFHSQEIGFKVRIQIPAVGALNA